MTAISMAGSGEPCQQRNAKHAHRQHPCGSNWQVVSTCSKRFVPCTSAGDPTGPPAASDAPTGCSTHGSTNPDPDSSETLAKHALSCRRQRGAICKVGEMQLQMRAGRMPHPDHHSTICARFAAQQAQNTAPPGGLGALTPRQVHASSPGVEGMQPHSQASDIQWEWQRDTSLKAAGSAGNCWCTSGSPSHRQDADKASDGAVGEVPVVNVGQHFVNVGQLRLQGLATNSRLVKGPLILHVS